jgi:hypothetical protein
MLIQILILGGSLKKPLKIHKTAKKILGQNKKIRTYLMILND